MDFGIYEWALIIFIISVIIIVVSRRKDGYLPDFYMNIGFMSFLVFLTFIFSAISNKGWYYNCTNTPIPYETAYEKSDELFINEQKTQKNGVKGNIKKCSYLFKHDVVMETKAPINEVVYIGTKARPEPQVTTPHYYQPSYNYNNNDELSGGAICRDGSRSYSAGRGTCSHHGGVAQWL